MLRRRLGPTFLAAALALAVAGGHAPARADAREDSRSAFRRGVVLAQGADYPHARDAFIEAYRLYPHPSILLNLGIARWKTGELAAAEQDLVKFLSDDGGASVEEVASARAALGSARAGLGTLRVRVAPRGARATLDDQPLPLVPGDFAEIRAPLGAHVLEVQADGYARKRQPVTVTAGPPSTVDLTLESTGGARAGGSTAAPGVAPDGGPSPRRTVGWVLVGVGGAGGVLALVTGLRAQALSHDYNDAPAGAQDRKTRSDGIFLRTVADVALITGVVSGAVGAYLLLTPDPARTPLRVVVGPAYAGVRAVF